MQKFRSAFTVLELLIVVTLLGLIAAFGIPRYNRSQERGNEREGEHNLSVIASAMETYAIRNDGAYPLGSDLDDIAEINTTLNLGIIEQNMTYDCTGDGSIFTCTADPDTTDLIYTWELDVSDTDEGDPRCSAGTCPTCTGGGC